MSDDPRDPLEDVERDTKALAHGYRLIFVEFINEGFSEAQALKLTCTMLAANMGSGE